ncbi:MAG: phosphate acyltransferase [Oscillospiraceae bacterium]|nr:phosphate acyltransferase [Oscillospiraceae bacterium]
MNKSVLAFLTEQANKNPKRFALPECEAIETLQAARIALANGIGVPVLVNDPKIIESTAAQAGVSLDGMEIVDITNKAARDTLIEKYMSIPERNASFDDDARLLKTPLDYAMMLVATNEADCIFCGHKNTIAEVLDRACKTIGLKDGFDTTSFFALVEVPGYNGPEGDRIIFTDCGLAPEPTPQKLASVAISAADDARKLMGWEPRVAFLSSSTDGSGGDKLADNVKNALKIVRDIRPDIKSDGEFQLDAAIIPEVASAKVHRPSDVAGKANVLIFPDSNSANIGLKMVQIFAHGSRYWHTFSGLRKPVANSSRAATIQEMVGDIAMVVVAAAD